MSRLKRFAMRLVEYKEIEVDYLNQEFKKQHGKHSGFTAQIIQHEIQHFSGELI